MPYRDIPLWKKMPFVKLLIPFMAGIIIQWYFRLPLIVWQTIFFSSLSLFISFFSLPFFTRYKLATLNGLTILFIFTAFGAMLVWYNDIRNHDNWFEKFTKNNISFIITLEENPIEKTKSFKANAIVDYIIENDNANGANHANDANDTNGKIILYFAKDSLAAQLSNGSEIIFNNPLQEIKNTGNPGSFDYKRYCLFQQITHQAYLKSGNFVVLNRENDSFFSRLIDNIR